ncbi:hypothetical protein ACLOJK_040425 [Asimina triloba]
MHHRLCTIVEHIRCSTFFAWSRQPWRRPEPLPSADEHHAAAHHAAARLARRPPFHPWRRRPTTTTTTPSTSPSKESLPPSKTHRRQALHQAIRVIHHDGDNEHIPDPSRSQADVDHSGHTRRVFLARHQQLQLNPAPIPSNLPKLAVAIFSSSIRPGSVDPGRSSCWPPSHQSQLSSVGPITGCTTHSPPVATHAHAVDDAEICRTRVRCPLPDATASLARCQLPAIPHVGKVGVDVLRPQRTTAMPTSHASAATVTAQLQCSIRIAYK